LKTLKDTHKFPTSAKAQDHKQDQDQDQDRSQNAACSRLYSVPSHVGLYTVIHNYGNPWFLLYSF